MPSQRDLLRSKSNFTFTHKPTSQPAQYLVQFLFLSISFSTQYVVPHKSGSLDRVTSAGATRVATTSSDELPTVATNRDAAALRTTGRGCTTPSHSAVNTASWWAGSLHRLRMLMSRLSNGAPQTGNAQRNRFNCACNSSFASAS